MKRYRVLSAAVLLGVLVFSPGLEAGVNRHGGAGPAPSAAALHIPFVANRGQVDDAVAYYARTFGGTVFVTRDGRMVLALPAAEDDGAGQVVIRQEIAGGIRTTPVGLQESVTRVSSLIGSDPDRWHRDLKSYQAVSLGSVYEGIDCTLRVRGPSVEKVFTLQPGADPARIRVQNRGVTGLWVTGDGELRLRTRRGDVFYSAPVAWQEGKGGREPVPVAYVVKGDTYGFELGPYDRDRPLVIDPILNATYLGGSMNDEAYSMAVAPGGNIYIAGRTQSPDFPGIDSASAQQILNGTGSGTDVFVALLDPAITTIQQATYLGGTLWDEPGYGSGGGPTIAVHPTSGKVYITGLTQSANFPMVSSGYDSTIGGGSGDAFVARLDPGLTTVEAATYYGSGGMDLGTALAVDPQYGDIYITGRTRSIDLPGTDGGFQPDPVSFGGTTWDGFVARFSPDLDSLVQASYIGMSGNDYPYSMVVDTDNTHPSFGFVFVTGEGNYDAYVYKLAPFLTSGSVISLGGSGGEIGYGIRIHPDSGDVYVCGATGSADFPGVAGGAQAAHAGTGYNDVFVASLAAHLGTLRQSTYFGGSFSENNCALYLDPVSGNVYLAGSTDSGDLPGTAGGIQPDNAGDQDAFAARLSQDLTTLHQATYYGGSSREMTFAIDTGATGNGIYVTGLTWSGDLPGMSATWSAQPVHGGLTWPNQKDAFLVRLSPYLLASSAPLPEIQVSPLSADFGTADVNTVITLELTVVNWGAGDLTVNDITLSDPVNFSWDIDAPVVGCGNYATTPGLFRLTNTDECVVTVSFHPDAIGSYLAGLTVHSDDPDEGMVDVELSGVGTEECWDVSVVDDGVRDVDIAVDSEDDVHLCYYRQQPSEADTMILRYATLQSGADTWAHTDVALFPLPSNLNLWPQCAIAVGTDGTAHIAYSYPGDGGELNYAWGDENGFDLVEVYDRGAFQGEVKIVLNDLNVPYITFLSKDDVFEIGVFRARGTPGSFSVDRVIGGFSPFNDLSPEEVLVDDGMEESESEELRLKEAHLYRWNGDRNRFETKSVNLISGESAEFEDYSVGRYYAGLDNIIGFVDLDNWAPDFYNLNLTQWSSYPNGDLSLEVDSQDDAHLLYFEKVNGWLTHTEVSRNLVAEVNLGAPSSTDWHNAHYQVSTSIAHSDLNIERSSMAVDSVDILHVAYLDPGDGKIKYATRAASGCQGLMISPKRWRFDDRTPGYTHMRPFFVTNMGDTPLSIASVDFKNLQGAPDEAFETVACSSLINDIPELELGSPIPGGEIRLLCVRRVQLDMVDHRAFMILQTDGGPITADLAADILSTADSSTGSSGCDCSTSGDHGIYDASMVVVVLAAVGLLWWRRKRLG